MKLGRKLPIAFAAIVLMVVLAALVGIYSLNQAITVYDTQVAGHVDSERTVSDIESEFKTQVQEWKNVLLRGSNAEMFDKHWQAFAKMESHVNEEATKLAASLPEGESKHLVSQFAQSHQQLGLAYRKGLDAFKAANFDASVGDASVKGIDREPSKLLEAASLRIETDSAAVAKEAAAGARRATRISLALMLLMAGVGAGVGLAISRQVIRQLGGEPQSAVDLSQRVASGNLTQAIDLAAGDSTSLMAQLDTMQSSLSQVVTSVRRSAESLEMASGEIASGNNDLSNRTQTQAHSLEKSASSMAVLGSAVQINADNAHQANQLASEASQVAVRGGQVVAEVVHTMQGISAASLQISDIIGVIEGIAFQTNILALNAAVEAARAGEQGRGFAVVASEVRSLAGRSAEAAKQIKSLIDTSVARVEQGTLQVDRAGNTMNAVVAAIQRVTEMASQIASESQEQAATVGQIGYIVAEMSHTTQQNAALVEEMAAAAEGLKTQAKELVHTVAVFKLDAAETHLLSWNAE
jgi:methyl-accepting chemotaxis protein-1 (serine sensor receptor)